MGPTMFNNPRSLLVGAGLSLVAFASIGLFSAGVPTIYCPMPTLTILPALILSQRKLHAAAVLIPLFLFVVWSPELLINQKSNLPKRTIGLIAVLSVLTFVYFVFRWNYAVQYYGFQHTMAVCLINVIWLCALWWVALRAVRRPSYRSILLTQWLLFVWLSWYAFPYLSELP